MKLIYIYGPQAVGKLTVAQAVSTLTRYKIFHNHITYNAVMSIFKRSQEVYRHLLLPMRALFLEQAAREDMDLIFTMVYARNRDMVVKRYVQAVEQHGGQVCFVHLTCDRSILEQRVGAEERRQHGKVTTVADLNKALDAVAEFQPFDPMPNEESLTIDTGITSPQEAAQQIVTHYHLPTQMEAHVK